MIRLNTNELLFLLNKTYRNRQVVKDDSDYQTTIDEELPGLPKSYNKSHTVMNTKNLKIKAISGQKYSIDKSLTIDDNFGYTEYPNMYLTHHTKRRELDQKRILKLSQPRILPSIGKKTNKKRFIRMKVNKSLSLSSELPPNDEARIILFNTAKACKLHILYSNRCVWCRHKRSSKFRQKD